MLRRYCTRLELGIRERLYGRSRAESQNSQREELTRWARSVLDLLHTRQDLEAWNDSLIAQTGLQPDLRSALGKLIASLMAAMAQFEREICTSAYVPELLWLESGACASAAESLTPAHVKGLRAEI